MQTLSFENKFFARNMHDMFNDKVLNFVSDENEPALHKWLRATGIVA